MRHLLAVFVAVLFFVLTPGILLSLPPGGSKVAVAATHAAVFGLVFYLSYKKVMSYLDEGFDEEEGFEDDCDRDEDGKCIDGFEDCDEDGNCE